MSCISDKKRFLLKIISIVMVYMVVLGVFNTNMHSVANTTNEYKEWKQSDSRWSEMQLGSSIYKMGKCGCAVTAVAMLVVHSQSRSESTFNPGILCEYLNENSGFNTDGDIYWGKVNGLVPEFTFEQNTTFSSTTKSDMARELKAYYDAGYYAVISVKDYAHWVAVDYVDGDNVYILDPAPNGGTNLFTTYDYTGLKSVKLFRGRASDGVAPYITGNYRTSSSLDLRKSASTYYDVIKTIPSGTTLRVIDISGNWGQVTYGSDIGWICLDYAKYIAEETTTPETTTIETTTTVETETTLLPPITVIKGDINNDGNINIDDMLILKQYILGMITLTSDEKTRADMNSDGYVNSIDISLICKYILK